MNFARGTQSDCTICHAGPTWWLYRDFQTRGNPIKMAFAKLKARLRARAIRTIDGLWKGIGSSQQPSAKTTSKPQDTDPYERTTL